MQESATSRRCRDGGFRDPEGAFDPIPSLSGLERSLQYLIAMKEKPYDFRDRSSVAGRGYILRRLAGQLVDAGSSVGANLEESADGQSKPDFISKQCIALKESREARFWLRLIAVSEPDFAPRAQPLIVEASEFVAMLTTSVKTARSNTSRGAE